MTQKKDTEDKATETGKVSENPFENLIGGYNNATRPKGDSATPTAWIEDYETEPIQLEPRSADTLSCIRVRVNHKGADMRLDVRRWDYSYSKKIAFPGKGASVPLGSITELQARLADVVTHVNSPGFTAKMAGTVGK